MKIKMRDGLHRVGKRTVLKVSRGVPVEVRSARMNLDEAFDEAQQFWGSPLDCNEWRPKRGTATWWVVNVFVPG